MNTIQPFEPARPLSWGAWALLASLTVLGATACQPMTMSHGSEVAPPPAREFGLGPRSSAQGLYVAALQPRQPMRPGRIQEIQVVVQDGQGRAVDDATIAVDGGMPQHGHGLPTRPRVTRNLGDGVYELEGLRFNMGGWWELSLTIRGAAGEDRVTFNLEL